MAAKVLDGRYKLIKSLGAGGFGRTFVARDTRRPGSPTCVVKQFKPASTDPGFIREARRLFNTEAETLEKLGKHDQIPQLLAYFEENQQFFLVQEFIEGNPLHDELKIEPSSELKPEGQLEGEVNQEVAPNAASKHSEGKTVKIQDSKSKDTSSKRGRQIGEAEAIANLRDILNVLEFVHAEGVIHRDIKPDNLIRRKQDGKLVLIDFGAVKAMQDGTQLETAPDGQSRFTVTIGTPGYMSSEQCAGRPNFTSDLYSAGMVTIKSLTGFDPIDLPNDPATGEIIWRNHAKITTGLAMVLTRMVKYHYKQRYQNVKEVQQALNAFIVEKETPGAIVHTGTQTSAKGANNATFIPKKQNQSNAGAEWLIGGLLLVVVGLAAVTIPLLNRPKAEPVATTPVNPVTNNNPPAPVKTSIPIPIKPASKPEYKSLLLEEGKESSTSGELQTKQEIIFTFNGKSGQNLKVNLTAAKATMSLLAQDEKPIDANASQVSSWTGTLATDGSYQIKLIASEAGNYQLSALLESATPTTPERSIQIR
jgi:serine/threonine protein kinase